MKTKLCAIALLFAVCQAFAQTPAALQSEVKRLYTACHDIDITALTEMLCVSNDNAYNVLDSHFLNDDQKFRYVFTNVKYNYGPVKPIDGKSYCAINFRNVVRVTYFKPIDVAAKEAALKESFNPTSIKYDKSRNAFLIVYNAKMVAILDGERWKFAFLDNTLPKVSEDCLTATIKKELGI